MSFEYPNEFLDLWKTYPRKVSKLAAFKAYSKYLKMGITHQEIIDGAKKYADHCSGREEKYIKHLTTWLSHGCWDDEYEEEKTLHQPFKTSDQRRIENFHKTGFWMQDWGQTPQLN